jgi:hypothetical protein
MNEFCRWQSLILATMWIIEREAFFVNLVKPTPLRPFPCQALFGNLLKELHG